MMRNLEEIRNRNSHTGMWPLKNGEALFPWLKEALRSHFGHTWDTVEVDSIQCGMGKKAVWKATFTRKVTHERDPFTGEMQPLWLAKTDTLTLSGEVIIEASFGSSMSATPVPQFNSYGRIYFQAY